MFQLLHGATLTHRILAFPQVAPEARGQVGEALAAYASVSDPHLLANLFRVALTKYAKVCAGGT